MTFGPTRRTSRLVTGGYQAMVGLYLTGLVVWLVLGLLPSLADAVPPLRSGLESIGDGTGPLAGYSRRITEVRMAGDPAVWVGVAYLFSILNLALGVLLMVKRPHDLVPRLLALAFMGTAATFNEPSHEVFHVLGDPTLIKASHFAFHVISGSAYLWAVVLFPGSPRRWPGSAGVRRLVAAGVTAAVAVICWRSSFIAHPPFFVVFFGVLIPVTGIVAQTLQLRRPHDVLAGEQSRLLRVALLPALAVAVVWGVGRALARLGWFGDLGEQVAAEAMRVFPAVFAVVPVMMFVAIVRHRLWDIDLVASKALLVAVLLTFVSAVYVGVVAVTGLLLQDRGWAVLVPLVVVACVAEPLRERCQTMANRLVFGQRLSPREAVRSLVDRFAGVGDVDELTELTRVVVQSTRADGAAIWLTASNRLVLLARHPPGDSAPARVDLPVVTLEACQDALRPADSRPVTYQGQLLGVISVSTPRGVSLTTRESRLLDDLSHHAGLLVANAELTVDLQRELAVVSTQAEELRGSRQEVVLAQDRQRRRLERDIHDGAQQQLVAFLIMLRSLRQRLGGGDLAAPDLGEARGVLAATQETLRRLSTGGAPALLVESGLHAALEDAAARIGQVGPAVHVRVTAPTLASAEAETAVYFCCLEALLNAVKHAAPTNVWVHVESDGRQLLFEVADDGAGFEPGLATSGSGLGNLGVRLQPLGGRVRVESKPGRGTTVRGTLPIAHVTDEGDVGLLAGASRP